MGSRTARLHKLLEPVITAMGYELVGIEHPQHGRQGLVRIYIDQPSGVTVDDCERVSRQVSAVLDVEDAVPGQYTLEVSSPGLDRPLFTPAHFERHTGAQVRIQLREVTDNRRKLIGTLQGMRGDEVVISCDGVEHRIPFNLIARARLVPDLG